MKPHLKELLSSVLGIKNQLQQLDGIYDVWVGDKDVKIMLPLVDFCQSFSVYSVTCEDRPHYPFTLKIEVDGVEFKALTDAREISELKYTMPEHFDFITKAVQ